MLLLFNGVLKRVSCERRLLFRPRSLLRLATRDVAFKVTQLTRAIGGLKQTFVSTLQPHGLTPGNSIKQLGLQYVTLVWLDHESHGTARGIR